MIKFRLRTLVHKQGLVNVPRILSRNLRTGLLGLGKHLAKSAQSRMRRDTGAERKSLKIEVSGRSTDLGLTVYSTLVQAKVDAAGLRRGVFPPFSAGTPLYNWAKRKAMGKASQRVKVTGKVPKRTKTQRDSNFFRRHRIREDRESGVARFRPRTPRAVRGKTRRARAINRLTSRIAFLTAKKIFRHGIKGTHWNKRALDANRARITRDIKNSLIRAMQEMKRKA